MAQSESHVASASNSVFSGGQIAGLDAVRGIAMLAGILLHSAISYQPTPLVGQRWPVHEAVTSTLCDVTYWGLHAVRLPTFFFLSGFFTEMIFQSHSATEFFKLRIRRLVIPFLVGVLTILPVTLAIWTVGCFITGRSVLDPNSFLGISRGPTLKETTFSPGHLWFLEDLIVMTAAWFVVRREFPADKNGAPNRSGWLRGPVWTPCLLAIAPTMILWGQTSPVTSFHNSFLLDATRVMYFFTYFLAGHFAFRHRDEFFENLRRPGLSLSVGLLFIGSMLMTFQPEVGGTGGLINRFLFSASVSLAAWFTIFGAMGLVVRFSQTERPYFRYLADASYWMYLIHLPIVGLAQIALLPIAISPVGKMLAVFSLATTVSLGSYAVFVRYTIIGSYLHGHRQRSPGPVRAIVLEQFSSVEPAHHTVPVWHLPHSETRPVERHRL